VPFNTKHRQSPTEATRLEAELEQLEAELGERLVQEAEEMAQRFPPDAQRVLSGLGLALAREAPLPRRRPVRWVWVAAASLLMAIAAGSWLLAPVPRGANSSLAQRQGQSALPVASSGQGELPPEEPSATPIPAPEVLQEGEAPAWLPSSEELEGIADLEQPGFALGI